MDGRMNVAGIRLRCTWKPKLPPPGGNHDIVAPSTFEVMSCRMVAGCSSSTALLFSIPCHCQKLATIRYIYIYM